MAAVVENFFEIIKKAHAKDFSAILNNWVGDPTIQGTTRYESMFRNGFIFKQYSSLPAAFEEIIEARKQTLQPRWMQSALAYVSRYPNYKSFTTAINTPDASFEATKIITNIIIKNVKDLINLGGTFKPDRLIVSEDKRGMFDFSLASQGLFRPIEFYSKSLVDAIDRGEFNNPFAHTGEPEGVIPPEAVHTKKIGNSSIFIFTIFQKDYSCARRQKGATGVFNHFPTQCVLKENNQGIFVTYNAHEQNKVYNGSGKYRLKYASSNKKSYIIYEKKSETTKYVDIFCPLNFIGSSDGNRIMNLIAPFLVSAALEEFNIQTRISVMRLGSDAGIQETISVPVKEYTENPMEILDRLLNLAGRYSEIGSFFAFLKIVNGNNNAQGIVTGDTSDGFSSVNYEQRDYMNDMFQRYKNWCEINKDRSFINTKVVNNNFQFTTFCADTSYSHVDFFEHRASADMETIIKNIQNIMFMFYYYMDFLAIEFTPMLDMVLSILKRFDEDVTFRNLFRTPKLKKDKKHLIRQYIIGILVEKYKLVTVGKYSDTKEQQVKKNTTFEQKQKELTEALIIL